MNAGPARLPQWMVTLDYCRELGVPIEVFTNVNADAYIYNESAGMTKPMRYRTAKADVYGYVSELLAKATDKGALDKELTAIDQEKLVEFLKDFGELGDKLTYEGGERRGYTTVPAAAGTPGVLLGDVPSASEVFATGVGRYFSFEFGFDQAMLMFQPVGGVDQIPRALTKAIGAHRIRAGAAVSKITDKGTGVTVTYTQGGRTKSIDADYCPIFTRTSRIAAKVTLSSNGVVGPTAGRAESDACGGPCKTGSPGRRRGPVKQEPKVASTRCGPKSSAFTQARASIQLRRRVGTYAQLMLKERELGAVAL